MTIILTLFFAVLMVMTVAMGNDPGMVMINHAALMLTIVGMGLSMGSFATALAYRLPRGLPYGHGPDQRPVRSMCPPCGRTLGALELIPVVSWVMQNGRCQCGKVAIPLTYPLIEIGTLVYTWLIFQFCGFEWAVVPRFFAVPFVVAAVIIAYQHNKLPRHLGLILLTFAVIVVAVEMTLAFGTFGFDGLIRKIVLIVAVMVAGVAAFRAFPRLQKTYADWRDLMLLAGGVGMLAVLVHPVLIFVAVMILVMAVMLDDRQAQPKRLFLLALTGVFALFLMWPPTL
jgi:prepilin signal peptidase PulO-like enzyme (type II secretory pathway)